MKKIEEILEKPLVRSIVKSTFTAITIALFACSLVTFGIAVVENLWWLIGFVVCVIACGVFYGIVLYLEDY